MSRIPSPKSRAPVVILIVFGLFGCIGLTLLVTLWAIPSGRFGAPPLVFRVFGSFIALGFMAVGFGVPLTVLLRGRGVGGALEGGTEVTPPDREGRLGYECPHCGAGLDDPEVSPSGDVKCRYCNKWWNIHH